MNKIEINKDFKKALDICENSRSNVFITGKAGTGKSTYLDYFRNQTKKEIVILAPTGVAALNVKGQTIHSFFKFPNNITVEEVKSKAIHASNELKVLLKNINSIIIDEISMVRSDLFDCIDEFLRIILKKKKPFGGIQMILIGDLFQLPPVVASNERKFFQEVYASSYFFDSKVAQSTNFNLEYIEFSKIYRQSEKNFINLLNSIRVKDITDTELNILNKRVLKENQEPPKGTVYLTGTNAKATSINEKMLDSLIHKSYNFRAKVSNGFDLKNAPTDKLLKLKNEAQVMFLNNDSQGRWVNGTMGKIIEITTKKIIVNIPGNGDVQVIPFKWKIFKYNYNSQEKKLDQVNLGSFEQFPLKVAWAMTIHKSQGKTFDKILIDLDRTFATGQSYVDLSRCRKLDGLYLKRDFKSKDIRVDYKVMSFVTKFQWDISEKELSFDEKIKLIQKSIKKRIKLKITYLKPNNIKSKRLIIPENVSELKFKGKSYIGIEAYCLQRNDYRNFRVDRILKMELQ